MNDKYVSIGKRIANERKRLGYTQQQAADLCEVSRVQWGRYEREDSELGGRVLKAFADLGASVSYILTGEASTSKLVGKFVDKEDTKPVSLSDEEWEMIQMYRKLNNDQKKTLSQTAKLFIQG